MVRKRRQAKDKQNSEENLANDQLPAKKPKKAVPSKIKTESDVGNDEAPLANLLKRENPAVGAVVHGSSLKSETPDGSDQGSDGSDSSSESDSSSDSDSDSSGSDSKSKKLVSKKTVEPFGDNNSVVGKESPAQKSSSSDSYHSDTEEEDKKRRKKQKNILQKKMMLAKKPRRGKQMCSEAMTIDPDDDEDIGADGNDVLDWPEADFGELLKRIDEQLPSKDSLKFDSRAAKLDWHAIKFKEYSARDCYDVWIRISKRIRRFRTLSEMLSDARDWITKPWTNFYRGTKKNRHPDMPSRPLSTYMIYYLEQKDRVAAEHPGMEMTQVSKLISELYKTLADDEKGKYVDLAAKERLVFDGKLSEFYKDHPEMIPQPHVKANSRENKNGPIKPNSPFKLFYQEQLKKFREEGMFDKKAVEEMARDKWRTMNDKKKLVWITWALDDLKRYENELQAYLLEHPEYVPPTGVKNVLSKGELAIKERLAGKPLKPPNSAYSYFSRVMLQSDEDVKSIPPKLRMAEISRKWKEISDAQKARYEEKVRELQEQYKLEFASYLEGLSTEEREAELKKTQPKRKQPAAKVEAPAVRRMPARAARNSLNLFKGEPAPPPVRTYDLFLQRFLTERPGGTSEAQRLKEAPKYWEILPESTKESLRNNLSELKQKYIKEYEAFLKSLSSEELKEFSLLKAKTRKIEEKRERGAEGNGDVSDSNDESDSEKNDSSSGSDGEGNASDGSKSSSSSASDG